MSENGEIYTTGKNFTLPPAVTELRNLTSDNDGGGYVDDHNKSEKIVKPETQGTSDHHEIEGVLLVCHHLPYHNKMIRNFTCIIIIFQFYLAKK